jgi:hypothetical protein
MTHDELSKKLEGLWHDSFKAPGYAALHAVVELHKPRQSGNFEYCFECNTWDETESTEYPCPTIQAIEKELK